MTLPHRLRWYDSPEGAREYLEEYRKFHRRLSGHRERRLLERFFRRMDAVRTVLDLPSGWGRYLPLLMEKAGRVIEADYSGEMLKLGRQVPGARPAWGRLRASGTCFPFAGASIDLVFSMRLNHHLVEEAHRRAHVEEIFRVARRYAVFTFFETDSLKNRMRGRKVRRGVKHPKSTLRLAQVQGWAGASGFEILTAPYLFWIGSGHRLVLAQRRAQPGSGPGQTARSTPSS